MSELITKVARKLSRFVEEKEGILAADRLGLLKLLEVAASPGDSGERAYRTAVHAMVQQKILDADQLEEIVDSVHNAHRAAMW